MTSLPSLVEVIAHHGITRLCHFTPSRNLPHIFRDGEIRATKDLADDVRACFKATDLKRLDGHRDKICCTIEYPNAYYWNQVKAKGEALLFPDWVVILIDPTVVLRPGTLFCTGNAARGLGTTARPGSEGLLAAYEPSVTGSGGQTFTRSEGKHLNASPTDLQAEVLVPGPIGLDNVQAIAVQRTEQAATEIARLRQLCLSVDSVMWLIAPSMFEPYAQAGAIKSGRRPIENAWIASVRGAHG